jgi:hypothetical protein
MNSTPRAHYYVIGLFVLFGLPPMMMDAATATIVASRQGQFKNTQMLIETD